MNNTTHVRALGDTSALCGDTDGRWTYVVRLGSCPECAHRIANGTTPV